MASPKKCKPQKLLACDLAAFSDVELDRYLDEHRLQCGARIVEVEDPENLSESFIQRLRDRARRPPSDVAPSRPVDLDQVNARLLEFSAQANPSRSLSPRPASPPLSDDDATLPPIPPEESATIWYNKLVLKGGRPLYPIHRFREIEANPTAYRDLLQPWQYYPNENFPDPQVFWEQWASWMGFRRFQDSNRTPDYPHYVDGCNAYDIFACEFRPGSTTYMEGLQRVLAHYGFSHPCQVHQDPEQQDKLTTWIEYLAYACCVHALAARRLKQAQPGYDEAWETLVNAKVLEASDTRESICDPEYCYQGDIERSQAWQAVELAEEALLSAQQGEHHRRGSSYGKPTSNINSRAAQSRLDAAKKELEIIDTRDWRISMFFTAAQEYRNMETHVERFDMRLRWISDQIPLIEAEINESRATKTSVNAIRGEKRRCAQVSTDTLDRKIRNQQQNTSRLSSLLGNNSGSNHSRGTSKRRNNSTTDHTPPLKRLRGGPQGVTSNVITEFPKGLQGSKASKIGRSDNNNRAMLSMRRIQSPKATKPSDRLPQGSGTQDIFRPLPTTPVLRRSARIRARQQILRATMTN
ncbi:hypothetical protein F4824DRAFT_483723 [Ustulina deusta]|nr:hypothetical protein F4824DRAFT_483723 [Ustulina deusta]